MNLKKIIKPVLILSCMVLSGAGCSGTEKAKCKRILQEIRTMIDTTIMDFSDYDVMLPPAMYAQWGEINNIFAVPKDNMVGTNDLDNAIKLLEFKTNDEIKQHLVKNDFMEEVTGAYYFRFMPVWSEKEIAYAQSKGFLIVNIFQSKRLKSILSARGYIPAILRMQQFLNAQQRLFVLKSLHTRQMGLKKF
jgi:hypothetical protein